MPRVEIEERVARLQRHHDFFERAVARALADAVDGALDLARAGHHGGQAVGHRHAEIVVAVHRQADLVDAAHVLAQVAEQLREFIRHGVADRVRNVDRGGAGLDDGFDHLREEIELGARGVLGRELDVVAELARDLHALDGRADDLLLRHVELVLAMDRAGREEHVDAAASPPAAIAFATSSMSSRLQRARPQMIGPCTSRATAFTLSQSPREAAGKPASMTSTPRSASARATRSFSGCAMLHPGDCSPSRSVVSKIMTRSRWDMGLPRSMAQVVSRGLAPATACGRAAPCPPSRSGDRDRPA